MKLQELFHLDERLLGADRRGVKYYINPRYPEVKALFAQQHDPMYPNRHPQLRGYMIAGNLYVWDARWEIHKYGREALHQQLGIGNDAYSGRPLVLEQQSDGDISVWLANIRRGVFVRMVRTSSTNSPGCALR